MIFEERRLSMVVRETASSFPIFANVALEISTDLANSILLIPFSANISHKGLYERLNNNHLQEI